VPLVAYAAMAVSDILVGNPALQVVMPFTMGLPVLVAAGRLWDLRPELARRPAVMPATQVQPPL
jgi:hypothetical protein